MSDNPSPKKPSRPIDPSQDRLADLFMGSLVAAVAAIAGVGAFWIIGSLVSFAFK